MNQDGIISLESSLLKNKHCTILKKIFHTSWDEATLSLTRLCVETAGSQEVRRKEDVNITEEEQDVVAPPPGSGPDF